jgi:glutamyl-tRNA synthetase
MPEKTRPIRTRFAPSPTGYLHVGGARTALFCWLFARKHQGTFILRIEDTDRERSTDESIEAIFDGMAWLNLDYDEGPYFQTKRFERYYEVIEQLLKEDKAYRCVCTVERLEKLREEQLANKQKPRYDGHCRDAHLAETKEPYVVRFRNPQAGSVRFHDLIRGEIVTQNDELDDLILARSDGTPTYNFTVVVDDWDMNISHVIRGDDHINNTPRQINILQALGAELPSYAHVPMILGSDGKRLSKRHGAVSLQQYREDGYLSQALLNYLVRLGWSHGDQEVFSREEMVECFNLQSINRAPAAFNTEKLNWMNQHYMKTLDPSIIVQPFTDQLKRKGVRYQSGPALEDIVRIQAERTKTLVEMAERSVYFYTDAVEYDEQAVEKHLTVQSKEGLRLLRDQFTALQAWDKNSVHGALLHVAEQLGVKLGVLAQPLRVAITGNTVSPSIDETLVLVGRQRVLERLNQLL